MLNSVVLMGRLTADPELQKVNARSGEVSVCRFVVAVDRPGNGGQADFIDCVAWRNQAENLVRFKKKGDPIAVEGRLQVDSYDSQGIRRKAARVIARRVAFLPTGRKQAEEAPLPAPPEEKFGDPVEVDPDEIPF